MTGIPTAEVLYNFGNVKRWWNLVVKDRGVACAGGRNRKETRLFLKDFIDKKTKEQLFSDKTLFV